MESNEMSNISNNERPNRTIIKFKRIGAIKNDKTIDLNHTKIMKKGVIRRKTKYELSLASEGSQIIE